VGKVTVTNFIPLIGAGHFASKELGLDVIQTVSYPKMQGNEQHIYANDPKAPQPFLFDNEDLDEWSPSLDKMKEYISRYSIKPTNIVIAVPPCAGFSLLNTKTSADAKSNICMLELIKFYVASESDICLFENAPGYVGQKGIDFISRYVIPLLPKGYKMTVVKTDTDQHGIPQHRPRTFTMIYKSDKNFKIINTEQIVFTEVPNLFSGLTREYDPKTQHHIAAHKDISSWSSFFNNSSIGQKILHRVINERKNKRDWRHDLIVSSFDMYLAGELTDDDVKDFDYVLRNLKSLKAKTDAKGAKTYRDSGPILFKDYTNAVVGRNQTNMVRTFIKGTEIDYLHSPDHLYGTTVHDLEIRPVSFRERMRLMGIKDSFNMVNPEKNENHLCQNVPIGTYKSAIKWSLQILNKENVELIDLEHSPVLFQVNTGSNMNGEVYFLEGGEWKDIKKKLGVFNFTKKLSAVS